MGGKQTKSGEVSSTKYDEIMRNIALFKKQTKTKSELVDKKPPAKKITKSASAVVYPSLARLPFPTAQPGFPLMLPPGLVPQVVPPGADFFSYFQQMAASGFPQHPNLQLNQSFGLNGNIWPTPFGNQVPQNFNQLVPPKFNQQINQNQMKKHMPNKQRPLKDKFPLKQQIARPNLDMLSTVKTRGTPNLATR